MSFLSARCSPLFLLAFAFPGIAGSPAPGINNFYQVDQHVFRGAQPTPEGFQYLANLGVKTVLDLREADERSKFEERLVTAAGLKYVNVPMTGLMPPTEAETSRVLGILEDASAGPVFVHCKRGADRTGAVIAAYRIDHDGWENARALKEAMSRGMSIFQFPRQSYIRSFRPRTVEAKALDTNAATPIAPATLLAPEAAR
jgi:tyrosine-protein phosphatase SIW14